MCIFLIESCGHVYNIDGGMFVSPGYPIAYQGNEHCTWNVTVDYGYLVELHVQLGGIQASPTCAHDALQVRLS